MVLALLEMQAQKYHAIAHIASRFLRKPAAPCQFANALAPTIASLESFSSNALHSAGFSFADLAKQMGAGGSSALALSSQVEVFMPSHDALCPASQLPLFESATVHQVYDGHVLSLSVRLITQSLARLCSLK